MSDMNLIYIGQEFYIQSRTIMSSIYTEDGERMDWGFVQRALQDGFSVNIRPATLDEIEKYKIKLSLLKLER